MKATTTSPLTKRELMLLLMDVGESLNVYGYAKQMMISLNARVITSEQFDMLLGDFEKHCISENIPFN